MIKWREVQIPYVAPDGIGAPPTPPRAAFKAEGTDGARLEAFRWGSALGVKPFMLELRRYGAPRADSLTDELGPAELPHLLEMQAAIDQLIPPGVMLMLILISNGPDATYPDGEFFVVRVAQPGVASDQRQQQSRGLIVQ